MIETRSLLRREEYKKLATVELTGSVLDIGGSQKSGYHELFKGNHTITTANIDSSYGADLIFDAEKQWPIPDGAYDAVLFVNVLEHLFEHKNAIEEAHRVLDTGGRVIGVVPFMFNVHGSPNDYFRYTASALERLFANAGFGDVRVTELGTGAFSVIYHALFGFMKTGWIAAAARALCVFLDRLLFAIKPRNMMSATYMPLGYYFEARKL